MKKVIKEKFFEKYKDFLDYNFKQKIIIGIFILIIFPLIIMAFITDLFVFIYIFILKKIFKLEVYYFSFTYLILFGETI